MKRLTGPRAFSFECTNIKGSVVCVHALKVSAAPLVLHRNYILVWFKNSILHKLPVSPHGFFESSYRHTDLITLLNQIKAHPLFKSVCPYEHAKTACIIYDKMF